MKKRSVITACLATFAIMLISFSSTTTERDYTRLYFSRLDSFRKQLIRSSLAVEHADLSDSASAATVLQSIQQARLCMKGMDLWLRYLQPLAYKSINAPLPVEWETEVFEKFEKPYRRDGAGLTLAILYAGTDQPRKDSIRQLISRSLAALDIYAADSTTSTLGSYSHFFLCNRLFLLNLAAIYTTGFDAPDKSWVIPELKIMLHATAGVYAAFNRSFPATPLPPAYLQLYGEMVAFTDRQPGELEQFDHYTFINRFVNPLFAQNQQLVLKYHVASRSLLDYSLSKSATSIFDKRLYNGQNAKGIFIRVTDSAVLATIDHLGKQLFYDPILSGNNMRSCASCHKPAAFFTDTAILTAPAFDRQGRLPRNTPSLVNVVHTHLLMQDGKHTTLQAQARDVMTNPAEMNCAEADVLEKVLSCKEYRSSLNELLQYTPQEKQVTFQHIASALTWYYGKYSYATAPFDDFMNGKATAPAPVMRGFNLFMGKAQCGTCHFVPQFSGVKPPFVSSEFEVIGTPADSQYHALSTDEGRFKVHAAPETRNAFRTATVRNAARTAPYMHNGVFATLEQVVDFYNLGGGAGKGLKVENQTLSTDRLNLTDDVFTRY